jgi:hypothetical protein
MIGWSFECLLRTIRWISLTNSLLDIAISPSVLSPSLLRKNAAGASVGPDFSYQFTFVESSSWTASTALLTLGRTRAGTLGDLS